LESVDIVVVEKGSAFEEDVGYEDPVDFEGFGLEKSWVVVGSYVVVEKGSVVVDSFVGVAEKGLAVGCYFLKKSRNS
jgi:hypothetical protein